MMHHHDVRTAKLFLTWNMVEQMQAASSNALACKYFLLQRTRLFVGVRATSPWPYKDSVVAIDLGIDVEVGGAVNRIYKYILRVYYT